MSRKKSPPPKQAAPSAGRWLRWTLLILLALLLLPILQVGCVRIVDPPTTTPMLLRQAGEKLGGGHSPLRPAEWLDLREIPADFLKFVFVAEDQRFFLHHGFDWRQIEISRRQAARKGRTPRGASTITQQCARSLFLWQGRSWVRKGIEAYYTVWMELLLPKRRILELYANVVEMGDGVYGVQAAARHHYGVPARDLTREQSAMLAALLPAPRQWNPRNPSPKLAARVQKLLRTEKEVQFPLKVER